MSAKTTGIIWDLVLPAPQRLILLSMVDHADHDGGHIHAAIPYIAWKTGYSARNTARIIQDLIDIGLLAITKQGLGESNEYQFDLSRGVFKPEYKGKKPKTQPATHDKMSGVRDRTHAKMAGVTHDKMSGVGAESPPTHDKMSPPHDKMSGVTHDKMAIDSISTIDGDDHVGDDGDDRARAKKLLQDIPLYPATVKQILALNIDPPTLIASIVYLQSENWGPGGIADQLRDKPPVKGQPYGPANRPIQSDVPPNRARRSASGTQRYAATLTDQPAWMAEQLAGLGDDDSDL